MSDKKIKNIFVLGAIEPSFIARAIEGHKNQPTIGAHSIFLGQVRTDVINEKDVKAIEYTSYEAMALEKMLEIREMLFEKYQLICLHVYHSLGRVQAGEISLFVFTSSVHRKDAISACEELVTRIKTELPIWGKEVFADESFEWKKPASP